MCILFLEYRPEDDGFPYSLVAACNRDAYFNKDTAPANFWDNNDDILAGKFKRTMHRKFMLRC